MPYKVNGARLEFADDVRTTVGWFHHLQLDSDKLIAIASYNMVVSATKC